MRLDGALGQFSLIALARDPVAPAVMYASASEYPLDTVPDDEASLFKSVDGGATWTVVAQRTFVALAVAPGTPAKLYVSDGVSRVFESTDGGANWIRIAVLGHVRRLLVDPRVATTLFALGDDGILRSPDGGRLWLLWNHGLANRDVSDLAFDPQAPTRLYATNRDGLSTRLSAAAAACEAGPTQLCLEGGRFRVEVVWRDFAGNSGVGTTRSLTDDTGAFWFFGPDNIELTVKVLDGRPVNGKFWVFYGSLTNVELTLTVTDTATSRQRVYHNPMGTFASAGHTDAF